MSQPTLVFLHGIGGGPAAFDQARPVFERVGWATRAWAHPGYPWFADQPDKANGAPCPSMRQAALLLDQWLASEGLSEVVLIGHSLGGMVALEYLAWQLDSGTVRCKAAVLAHSSPAFGNADGAFQEQFIAQRTAILDKGGTMQDLASALVPRLLDQSTQSSARLAAEQLMAAILPQVYRTTLRALVDFDQRSALGRIHQPVFCLAAQNDVTAPPAVIEKMAAKLPAGHYTCLPGLGHLAPMQAPGPWAEAILKFLEERV